MSRAVEEMIDDVIRREGGYVDHLQDRGGRLGTPLAGSACRATSA
jgi:lysozyme family protein